jgi:hypothetical protein
MFECNKCEYEETELCNDCVEVYCKPSNWKRVGIKIEDVMRDNKGINIDKCK